MVPLGDVVVPRLEPLGAKAGGDVAQTEMLEGDLAVGGG